MNYGSSKPYGRQWRKARALYLSANPLCVMCKEIDRLTPSKVVDHITPHRGDMRLFWDRDNWQALCKRCHDSHKQRQEKSGKVIGCDANGFPIDPLHHWGWGG